MKYLYLLLVFAFTSSLAGQTDYHFFQPEVQYLFKNAHQLVDETTSRHTGIRVEDDECSELYRTVIEKDEPNSINFYNHLIVPSFAGLRICQTPDSIRLEVGKENDVVILQHAEVGEAWNVTVEDSILVTGRVDSIRAVEIDGAIDSVKYINFFKGDALLLVAPVELSKANGLRKAAYFWGLLSMRETLDLVEPFNIPTWETVHSFAVGDEYHVESVTTEYVDVGSGYEFMFTQEIFRVLSVTDSSGYRIVDCNSDRLTYSSPRYEDRSGATDSVLLLNQTVRLSYREGRPSWLNEQPGAFTIPGFMGLMGVVDVGGSCFGARKFGSYPLRDGPLYHDPGYSFDLPLGESYYEGVAGPYRIHYDQSGLIEGRSLIYSSRHGSVCYVPFDFSGITAVPYVEDIPGVEIFPNPADDFINIHSAVERADEVILFDGTGRMVRSQKTNLSSVEIKGLPAGVYNLAVHFSSGKKLIRRVVVFR